MFKQTRLWRVNLSLIARNIQVSRSGTKILHGIPFQAQPGQLIGLLGPSGAGKSTLLYALSGFRPANEGSVLFNQASITEKFEDLKHQIGFVPQDDVVPMSLKVERVLSYAADLRLPDEEPDERTTRVERILYKLGLKDRRKLSVSKLSGGQRKRVSVGVELLTEPALLFADEPTSGLDPALERSLMEMFRELADDDKMVIMTTHIMTSVDLFDLLCVLHEGHLAYFGPPEEMKSYFGVEDYIDIYASLQKKPASQHQSDYLKSTLKAQYLS